MQCCNVFVNFQRVWNSLGRARVIDQLGGGGANVKLKCGVWM